jgi:hypothetical protein
MDLAQALTLTPATKTENDLQKILFELFTWFEAVDSAHPHPLTPIKAYTTQLPCLYCETCDWAWDFLDPTLLEPDYLVQAKMVVDKKAELARIKNSGRQV